MKALIFFVLKLCLVSLQFMFFGTFKKNHTFLIFRLKKITVQLLSLSRTTKYFSSLLMFLINFFLLTLNIHNLCFYFIDYVFSGYFAYVNYRLVLNFGFEIKYYL